jgi:hypothetical protein
MLSNNPKQSEKLPLKANEYWAFVMWKSLPASLRKLDSIKLGELGFDVEILDLLKLKNHSEFCKQFGVCMDSLTDWQRLPRFSGDVMTVINNTIVHTYKSAIDHNFTMKTLQEADASRVKLWKQLYEGWTEKGELEHSGIVDTNLLGSEEITKTDIINLVIGKVANKQGINAVELMDKMKNGFYKDLDIQDAEVVSDFRYPSDHNYDFNEIQKQNKGIDKAKMPTPNGELSKASAELKAKLLERLKDISNEKKSADTLNDAIKRVKNKNKGKGKNGKK